MGISHSKHTTAPGKSRNTPHSYPQDEAHKRNDITGADPFGDDLEIIGYTISGTEWTRTRALADSFLRSLEHNCVKTGYGFSHWPTGLMLSPSPPAPHPLPVRTARSAVAQVENPPRTRTIAKALFDKAENWKAYEQRELNPIECLPSDSYQRGLAELARRYRLRQREKAEEYRRQAALADASLEARRNLIRAKAHARIDELQRQEAAADSEQQLEIESQADDQQFVPVDSIVERNDALSENFIHWSTSAPSRDLNMGTLIEASSIQLPSSLATPSAKSRSASSARSRTLNPIPKVKPNSGSACFSQITLSECELAQSREAYPRQPIRTRDDDSSLLRSEITAHIDQDRTSSAYLDEVNRLWNAVYGGPVLETDYFSVHLHSSPEHRNLSPFSSSPNTREMGHVVAVGDLGSRSERFDPTSIHSECFTREDQEQSSLVDIAESDSRHVDVEVEAQPLLSPVNVEAVPRGNASNPSLKSILHRRFRFLTKFFQW